MTVSTSEAPGSRFAASGTRPPDFKVLFESAPGLYLVLTPELNIVAVSDAYLRATMTRREEILGRALFDVFPDNPDEPGATGVQNLRTSLQTVLRDRVADAMAVQKYDIRKPQSEGGGFEERYWSPVNSPVLGPDGRVVYIIHRVEDVTEFVRVKKLGTEQTRLAEELRSKAGQMEAKIFRRAQELQEANKHLRQVSSLLDAVVEHIPDMLFLKDAKTLCFERVNRAAEAVLGIPRSQLIGKSDLDFFPKAQADFFQKKDRDTLAAGQLLDIPEEPLQSPNGTRWLHTKKVPISGLDGKPTHLLGISSDITERKMLDEELRQAREDLERRVEERTADLRHEIEERQRTEAALRRSEEQLLQAQKMEAVGRLAAGIAHDFNNLLAVIISYSNLAMHDLKGEDPLREELQEIYEAGQRAATLTRQLLAFSRQQVLEPRVLNLNDIVTGMGKMLRRLIGEDIQLAVKADAKLYKAKVDPGQIEQVIMNLVVNARDAMPKGGKVTIETTNVDLDEAYAREHLGTKPGPHVMLAVTDTGFGMDKATQARIFEPFFTTKEQGKGTGLGLSTVFGIVRQSAGSIWVYSEPGHGTTFKVFFPRAEDAEQEDAKPVEVTDLRGTETVLLVEDEDQVRNVARSILNKYGYNVLEAKNAGEALLIGEQHSGEIHLLLSDVVMPKLSGVELAKRLASARPGMKLLCMSGYTNEAVVNHGLIGSGIAFLQKPFSPEGLARRVRQVLVGPETDRR